MYDVLNECGVIGSKDVRDTAAMGDGHAFKLRDECQKSINKSGRKVLKEKRKEGREMRL